MATAVHAGVPGRPALRLGRFSVVWRPRAVLVLLAAAVVLVLGVAMSIGLGEYPMSVGDVLAALLGGGAPGQRFIVLELRAPRALTGALVGGALALSGAITQTIARNPLASPDVIGFTMGASAAAVAVIVLGGSGAWLTGVGLPTAALVGGLLVAAVIHALAWRQGIHGFRLVLVGIGINAILVAVVEWLLTAASIFEAARAYTWLTGSLNARGWEHVVPVGTALAVLVPAALILAHVLGALQFGDDTVRSLGVPVDAARSVLLLVAVGLCAVATASAGPIAFVALVAPQIAQRLVGSARPPLVASLLVGASLTVLADLVARTARDGTELPVGIVTAVLGAPYLLYLLARHGREARA